MIWTKLEIEKYMDKWTEEQEYIIDKKESKAGKTRRQEKTYYKIFWWIWNFLWYDKEVVKQNILKALFGTYEVKMFWETHLVANKSRTRDLTKEEAILLIDSSLAYAKNIGAGIEITSVEMQSLYDSYN